MKNENEILKHLNELIDEEITTNGKETELFQKLIKIHELIIKE